MFFSNNHKAAGATCYVWKINMSEPRTESRPVNPRHIGDNSVKCTTRPDTILTSKLTVFLYFMYPLKLAAFIFTCAEINFILKRRVREICKRSQWCVLITLQVKYQSMFHCPICGNFLRQDGDDKRELTGLLENMSEENNLSIFLGFYHLVQTQNK